MQPIIRSYLYVPADSGDRLIRSGERGADAVIADLEDSVAPSQKPAARAGAADWLAVEPSRRTQRWVRVNPGAEGISDLHAVFRPGLTGVCLAKTSGATEVRAAARALELLESQHGRPVGSTALMPLIETALGLERAFEIAAEPRVRALQLGEIDLAADLGLASPPLQEDLAPLRSRVVVASAAAGLLPPVGPASPGLHDITALRETTIRLKAAGFVGRAAVHPRQLPTIHEVFAVSHDELAAATAAVALYDAARAAGRGAATDDHGRMVDEATVRSSRRLIALAAAGVHREREEQP